MSLSRSGLCLVASLLATTAHAETWDLRVTPFFWAAGIDGDASIGSIESEVDVSFSDILDALEFGGLVHVELHRGGHGLFTDVVYLSLQPEGSPSPFGGEIDVEAESLFAELGYIWKAFGDTESGIEFGMRYYDQELSIDPPNLDSVERSKSWADGFIGFRWHRPLSAKWSFLARGNIGAGDSDLAWSLTPTFLRELSSGNQLAIGLRSLDVDYEDETENGVPFTLDVNYAGLIIGYTFD
jgi:hypothetical protein